MPDPSNSPLPVLASCFHETVVVKLDDHGEEIGQRCYDCDAALCLSCSVVLDQEFSGASDSHCDDCAEELGLDAD